MRLARVLFTLGSPGFRIMHPILLTVLQRLALGVAWIVIVPAEFLGITSGLGYTIQDSRENLMYADLAVTILAIGIIGFLMDGICQALIKRFSWHRN